MSTEIIRCSIEGPTVEELEGIVDKKYQNKDRWAVVKCECCKEHHDRPFRKLYFDLETGLGATADDPRTLHSFAKVVEILEADNSIQYIVYLPDNADDAKEVAEMNQRLCPVQMEVLSQPTYWDLQDEESIKYSDCEQPNIVSPVDLFGYVAAYAFDNDHARTLLILDAPIITSLINEYARHPRVQYSEDWIRDLMDKAFESRNRYLISGLWCGDVLVTKEPATRFGGPAEEMIHSFERLI
jgi:hypothetical protein